jgi:hypothetical protein
MYLITDFLKQGKDKKIAIKQLQALLVFLGDIISVDGDFGYMTTKAVKRFQEKNSLNADGMIGEQSWIKLYSLAKEHVDNLSSEMEMVEELSIKSEESNLILWLSTILYLIDNRTDVSPSFSKDMEESIFKFQAKQGHDKNGCVDFKVWDMLFESSSVEINSIYSMLLTNEYIDEKAVENGLDPASVKAVIKVESSGRGFYRDKRPTILFEGHKFWRQLKSKGFDPKEFVEGNEDILYRSWTKKYYSHNSQKEYNRLDRAMAIDEESALKSASWGMFQIMGFNYKSASFDTVYEFVEYVKISEKNQLEVFFTFLKKGGCFKHLENKDWAKFARCYNGTGFKENGYDSKLEKAYFKSKDIGGDEKILDEIATLYASELEEAFSSYQDR